MGVIATSDDLIKMIEVFGDMAHNAGIAIRKVLGRFDRFNRYWLYEYKMRSRSLDLYTHPNNKRKIDGKPLVRIRAYKKAWRNERRRK